MALFLAALYQLFFGGKQQGNSLDDLLFRWGDGTPFSVRDACQNTAIIGKTGSGKTSGAGDYILRSMIRANSGGLWIASKPEDKAYAIRLFREEGRPNDLLIMEPGGDYRFNILDHERAKGADTRELAQAFVNFNETLDRSQGTNRDPYWLGQARIRLHNGIEIMTRATGKLDSWDLKQFLDNAPLSMTEIGTEDWKNGYHNEMLGQASRNCKTKIERRDYKLAEEYFLGSNARLNDKTKTSIDTSVNGMMHVFNTGLVNDMLGTTTNITPDMLDEGKWWFVNMPIVPGDTTATFINTAIKYAVQRHILRRAAKPNDPLLVVWADEFQKIVNTYDSQFLAECRSHKGCMVALTQSAHALYANMGGKESEHVTKALLTNFGTFVWHTLGDNESAELASGLLGKRKEILYGTSYNPHKQELFDTLMGNIDMSISTSEHYEAVLQPAVFMNGLRMGGPINGNIVDGIVIRGGQGFRNGENYLKVAFKQK